MEWVSCSETDTKNGDVFNLKSGPCGVTENDIRTRCGATTVFVVNDFPVICCQDNMPTKENGCIFPLSLLTLIQQDKRIREGLANLFPCHDLGHRR